MMEQGKRSSPHSPELEVDSKPAPRRGPRSSCVGKFKARELRGDEDLLLSTATSATATHFHPKLQVLSYVLYSLLV